MNPLLLTLVMLSTGATLDALTVQGPLEAAKAHYTAAAYEEALATLATVKADAPDGRVEIEQYRALCLIALGRVSEAERAVARLVEANPTYMLSTDVASPRVLSLVSEMRRKELPSAARRLLESGRQAFEEKDSPLARKVFQRLLDLLAEEDAASLPDREDLRTLAQGFVSLTDAWAQSRLEADRPPVRDGAGVAPAAPPAERPVHVPAVALQQEIPSWVPPDVSAGARTYKGAIRVRIGADGHVTSARIEETTHPAFDARLLKAAEGWIYRPATRNGSPVESEKVVVVQLNPRP